MNYPTSQTLLISDFFHRYLKKDPNNPQNGGTEFFMSCLYISRDAGYNDLVLHITTKVSVYLTSCNSKFGPTGDCEVQGQLPALLCWSSSLCATSSNIWLKDFI